MARGSPLRLSSSIVVLASTLLASTSGLPMTLSAETGIASVYAYSGELTANGETASPSSLTAAHRSLPFGTLVRVTNDVTGDWVVVRINDRGPFSGRGRIIDLSRGAGRLLGVSAHGSTPVRVRVVEPPEADRRRLREGKPALERAPVSGGELAQLRAGLAGAPLGQ